MEIPTWVKQNSPALLSGAAIAGVIATAVLTAKAAIKAYEKGEREGHGTPKEFIQANWVEFVPVVVTGAATVACIVGANQIGARRNAALLGAYTLADTAFREYKEEVLSQIGRNKEMKVIEAVQQAKIDGDAVESSQVIITGGGDQLCYETLTGRYFRSDIENVRRAENELNRRILTDMYASLNEFFDLIGLETTALGDDLGWNIENTVEVIYTSHLATNGTPCLALGYQRLPRIDYGKL